MVILDSGGTEAPLSLIAICWTGLLFGLPLAPLTQVVFGKLAAYGPPDRHAIYWVLVLINSFVAVSVIYFVIRIVRRLLLHQSKFAHE